MLESDPPGVMGLLMEVGKLASFTGSLLEVKLQESENLKPPNLSNIKSGIKTHGKLLWIK